MAVHEGGAIEFSGHKVLTIPSQEGKITAQDVENYIETFESDFKKNTWCIQGWFIFHIQPNMELYTRKKNYNLYLEFAVDIRFHYLWMVRLGYGLMSNQTNVTIEDVAKYCDVFYIGGTKIGALCVSNRLH